MIAYTSSLIISFMKVLDSYSLAQYRTSCRHRRNSTLFCLLHALAEHLEIYHYFRHKYGKSYLRRLLSSPLSPSLLSGSAGKGGGPLLPLSLLLICPCFSPHQSFWQQLATARPTTKNKARCIVHRGIDRCN